MVSTVFVNVKAGLQIEDRLAVLDGNDAPCREAAAIADSVDLVQDRHQRVTRPQKVGVQRMHLSAWIIDGARRGDQRLTGNLAAENPLTAFVR